MHSPKEKRKKLILSREKMKVNHLSLMISFIWLLSCTTKIVVSFPVQNCPFHAGGVE